MGREMSDSIELSAEQIDELTVTYSKIKLGIKLRPCPCCGARAAVDVNRRAVDCSRCGMTTGLRYALSIAVNVWNTRVNSKAVAMAVRPAD
jgi:hypothetical protein